MTASKNLAASVKQRSLSLSRKRGLDFNLVLTRYGVERILYRPSCSAHRGEFVLKGAMLFHLWIDAPHRPTRDVDLLGEGTQDVERVGHGLGLLVWQLEAFTDLPGGGEIEDEGEDLRDPGGPMQAWCLPPMWPCSVSS